MKDNLLPIINSSLHDKGLLLVREEQKAFFFDSQYLDPAHHFLRFSAAELNFPPVAKNYADPKIKDTLLFELLSYDWQPYLLSACDCGAVPRIFDFQIPLNASKALFVLDHDSSQLELDLAIKLFDLEYVLLDNQVLSLSALDPDKSDLLIQYVLEVVPIDLSLIKNISQKLLDLHQVVKITFCDQQRKVMGAPITLIKDSFCALCNQAYDQQTYNFFIDQNKLIKLADLTIDRFYKDEIILTLLSSLKLNSLNLDANLNKLSENQLIVLSLLTLQKLKIVNLKLSFSGILERFLPQSRKYLLELLKLLALNNLIISTAFYEDLIQGSGFYDDSSKVLESCQDNVIINLLDLDIKQSLLEQSGFLTKLSKILASSAQAQINGITQKKLEAYLKDNDGSLYAKQIYNQYTWEDLLSFTVLEFWNVFGMFSSFEACKLFLKFNFENYLFLEKIENVSAEMQLVILLVKSWQKILKRKKIIFDRSLYNLDLNFCRNLITYLKSQGIAVHYLDNSARVYE